MQHPDRLPSFPDLETIIDRSPLTVAPNTSALDAIKLMSRECVSCLFIVEDLQLLGSLTEKEALKLSISGMDLSHLKIAEVMERSTRAIDLSQIKDLSTVWSLLEQHQTSHLPVLDEKKQLLGTISNDGIWDWNVKTNNETQQLQDLIRSNAELEQFAYIASHDLQEPLRMVIGYLQLLERRYKGKLDRNADEFISYALDGANRMQTLINDLLSFSRLGTRAQALKPVNCQIVLERAIANLKVAIEESGAVITYDSLPEVMADTTQLTQLFQNLLGNAIKFRSDRSPRIYVGVEPDRGNWLFSVTDNGIGIESQYAERIFLIFQRLHSRQQYPGTGIGLAVCKKIVERHGGNLWLKSELGQGSVFYFTIPDKIIKKSLS